MKRPLAYITAPWSENEFENTENAAKYCRAVYDAGFSPICPTLFLPLFLRDEIPQEHKDCIDMAREYLRRARVLVVCGSTVDESVKNDIAVAERLRITATTLDGILTVKGQGRRNEYPYVWGGSSPSTSFDCSGFVSWVINHSGWDVGRLGAQGLCNICTPVSSANVKPGDLVFFTGTYDTPGVSHVGIYVGNNMMIHCGDPISYANLNSSYWQSHFYRYRRLP